MGSQCDLHFDPNYSSGCVLHSLGKQRRTLGPLNQLTVRLRGGPIYLSVDPQHPVFLSLVTAVHPPRSEHLADTADSVAAAHQLLTFTRSHP